MTIRRPSLTASLLVLFVAGLVAPAAAQEAAAPSGLKGDMLWWIQDAESKLVQLAEATPEDKYGWRPNQDVRTTAEVFMHVATANFGAPGFWGVKRPEGFDFATFEKSQTKKAEVVKTLKDSFAHAKKALTEASDADFDKPVELMGMKTTVRNGYLLLLAHAHEHLGQSIAYARSNGIVPPWTARQQEQMKALEEKKKAEGK